jgi:hypothetical protein
MIDQDMLALIGHPLLTCALLALTLTIFLVTWVLGKGDNARLRRKLRRQEISQKDSEQFLIGQIAALRERLVEVEERSSLLVQPPPSRSGLNLTRRAQALRMVRRGDNPEQVAAALSMPQNEVRLLSEVYKATQG